MHDRTQLSLPAADGRRRHRARVRRRRLPRAELRLARARRRARMDVFPRGGSRPRAGRRCVVVCPPPLKHLFPSVSATAFIVTLNPPTRCRCLQYTVPSNFIFLVKRVSMRALIYRILRDCRISCSGSQQASVSDCAHRGSARQAIHRRRGTSCGRVRIMEVSKTNLSVNFVPCPST